MCSEETKATTGRSMAAGRGGSSSNLGSASALEKETAWPGVGQGRVLDSRGPVPTPTACD